MADDGHDKDPEEEDDLEDEGDLEDDEGEDRGDEDDLEDDEELEDDEDEELEVVGELETEVERLEAEVSRLERTLEEARGRGPTSRWATWILGTLAAASGLVLVVIFLGQGFPVPQDCPETTTDPAAAPAEGQEDALYALLSEHADELQTCFDRWAAGSRARPGTIIRTLIEVEAGEGGEVSSVEVSGEDVPPSFATCLRESVSQWTFPTEGQFALEAPFEVRGGGAPDGAVSDASGALDAAVAAGGSEDGGATPPTSE